MEEKKAESLYDKKSVEMDERAVELAVADEATRRAINMAVKDYNIALVSVAYPETISTGCSYERVTFVSLCTNLFNT